MRDSGLFGRIAKLAFLIPILLFAGCDTGNGPTPIPGTPPPPPPPAGTCDPNITFEPECGIPRGEVPAPQNFNGGATDIEPNPVKAELNDSETVAKMRKFPEEVFGGTKFVWPGGPIDFSRGEFFLMKVWSSRDVPVSFKLEEIGNAEGGFTAVASHTGGSEWQLLCFDMTAQAVPTQVIEVTVIFDNNVLGRADTDPDNWTFYYDDIEQVSACPSNETATPVNPDATLFSSSGAPSLVIPDDYAERTAFDSGSIIDPMYADDAFFSPVLSVWSGTGYGANVAQVGFIGFPAGFLGAYETVDFKVKGMPNQVIFVKLYDGVNTLRISLTGSSFSGALEEDGWFQVSIPVERFSGVAAATGIVFESDNTSIDQFRMLLTDIGFSGSTFEPADPGITPDAVVYATDPSVPEDLAPGAIENFGSGAVFVTDFAGDADFNPSLQTISGEGYGAGNHNGFAAFTGYAAGFASSYETLVFKVKGDAENLDDFEVKFFAPDQSQRYDLTTYPGTTDLGNGWIQVEIPMSDFATQIDANNGFLLGPFQGQPAPFSFLMTDIGFMNPGGGGSDVLVNGDFETGDFTGWTVVLGPPNTGTAVPDNSGQGGRTGTVAKLDAAGQGATGNDVLIVQGPIGAGTIQAGDTINVSFDLYGSLAGPGGVVFVEVIFLDGSGNDNGRDFLNSDPMPYSPNDTWTTYSGSVTAGTIFGGGTADVSGGITLSLKAACGADVSCATSASFDNVTLTIN